MGGATPKQYLNLGGLPILVHSLRALEQSPVVTQIVMVAPSADRAYCLDDIVAPHHFRKVTHVIAGGDHRQDSVRHGLEALGSDVEIVLVHDAVRPFLTTTMIEQVVDAAAKHGAAIIAIPMKDTVKRVGADALIEATVDRGQLWLAQTPQAFQRALLHSAHQQAQAASYRATDDAQLMEWLGHRVAVVEGSGENIKITRPEDLTIGEAILSARERHS
jgi:2-C-methyl-D-erythritol 4-phosphate cytidylyltransferase